MRFYSTRDPASAGNTGVDLAEALIRGLAPDRGLYLPGEIPPLADEDLAALTASSNDPLSVTAEAVLAPFLVDVPEDARRELLADALSFPAPLEALALNGGRRIYILELFHGPTLAFKDVGARFLARFLGWFRRHHRPGGDDRPLTVLVATSGDTGSAVARAFYQVPGTRVVVLYPEGKVSPLQEAQMATLGGNVTAFKVAGVFDDCQRLVKAAFADPELRERLLLTSANSINIGRLLPQMVYYFHAFAQLGDKDRRGAPERLLFATPSGNFGNLTAGMMARRRGLPCRGFVAATNANDVVPEFLRTGRFRPRPSQTTLSNAMDVGDPSNFERMVTLHGGSQAELRASLDGSRHDDEATRSAIRRVFEVTGRVLDPHTAVGLLGLEAALERPPAEAFGVLLSTAHPAKFQEEVEPLLRGPVEIPERLAQCLDRPIRARELPPDEGALRRALLDL